MVSVLRAIRAKQTVAIIQTGSRNIPGAIRNGESFNSELAGGLALSPGSLLGLFLELGEERRALLDFDMGSEADIIDETCVVEMCRDGHERVALNEALQRLEAIHGHHLQVLNLDQG